MFADMHGTDYFFSSQTSGNTRVRVMLKTLLPASNSAAQAVHTSTDRYQQDTQNFIAHPGWHTSGFCFRNLPNLPMLQSKLSDL